MRSTVSEVRKFVGDIASILYLSNGYVEWERSFKRQAGLLGKKICEAHGSSWTSHNLNKIPQHVHLDENSQVQFDNLKEWWKNQAV